MHRKIIVFFVSVFVISIILQCQKESVNPQDNYNFYDLRWNPEFSSVDDPDADEDGYETSAILHCFVNLELDIISQVFIKLYYRPAGSSETYQLYTISDTLDFDGIDSPLLIPITIGAQISELPHNNYEFMAELYEADSKSENPEPVASTKNSETINAVKKFEKLGEDRDISLSAEWIKLTDNNKDGYIAQATLKVDVGMAQITGTSELRIEIQYKKSSEENSQYRLYTKSEHFEAGLFPESQEITIGAKPDTIPHSEYDFKVLVYKTSGFMPIASLTSEENTKLKKKFQTFKDDNYFYHININRLEWIASVDLNNNGWAQSRTLRVDVDMEKDTSIRDIITMLYIMHEDSSSFIVIDSQKHSISGYQPDDFRAFEISGSYEIEYNDTLYEFEIEKAHYNFMIEVFEDVPESQRISKASVSSDSVEILKHIKFESAVDDIQKQQ